MSTIEGNRIWRARIPPSSPREVHHFHGGVTYEKSKGWYAITSGEKSELSSVLLHDTSGPGSSPPLFQIVTIDEAKEIDRQEAQRKKGNAKTGIDPRTGQPFDGVDDGAEVAELRTKLAASEAKVEELAAGQAQTNALLAKLTGLLEGNPQLAALLAGGAVAPAAASPEKPADDPSKPARPGSRRGGGGKAKPDAEKPAEVTSEEAEPQAPSPQGVIGAPGDPMGARAAADAIDKQVRDQVDPPR